MKPLTIAGMSFLSSGLSSTYCTTDRQQTQTCGEEAIDKAGLALPITYYTVA